MILVDFSRLFGILMVDFRDWLIFFFIFMVDLNYFGDFDG